MIAATGIVLGFILRLILIGLGILSITALVLLVAMMGERVRRPGPRRITLDDQGWTDDGVFPREVSARLGERAGDLGLSPNGRRQ